MDPERFWGVVKAILIAALIVLVLGAALYGCYELLLTIVGDVAGVIKSS